VFAQALARASGQRRVVVDPRATEDLIHMLRNRDENEWRPDVFELVAALLVERGIAPLVVMAIGPDDQPQHR
jgi:hypothetical protein